MCGCLRHERWVIGASVVLWAGVSGEACCRPPRFGPPSPCLDRESLFGPPLHAAWTVRTGARGPNRRKGVRTGARGSELVSVQRRCTVGVHLGARLSGRGGPAPGARWPGPGRRCTSGAVIQLRRRPDSFIGAWRIGRSPCPRGPCSHGPYIYPRMSGTVPAQPPRPQSPRPSRTTAAKTPILSTTIAPITLNGGLLRCRRCRGWSGCVRGGALVVAAHAGAKQ